MHAKLIVTGSKASKKEMSLKVPIIVGRSRTAGLTIAHPMISRQHCEITESDGLLRIRDLSSTNGTYVGGEKIDEAVLRPHEQFTIGPLTFEVDYEYAGDSTVAGAYSEEQMGSHAAGRVAETSPAADAPAVPESAVAPPEAEPAEDAVFDFLVDSSSPAEPAGVAVAAEPPDGTAEAELPELATDSPVGKPAQDSPLIPGIAPPDGEMPDFSAWSEVPEGDAAASSKEATDSDPPTPSPSSRRAQETPGSAASGDHCPPDLDEFLNGLHP